MEQKKQLIREILSGGRWLYSLEIVNESDGQISRSSIYTLLHLMQRTHEVTSRRGPIDPKSGIARLQFALVQ